MVKVRQKVPRTYKKDIYIIISPGEGIDKVRQEVPRTYNKCIIIKYVL